MTTPPNRTKASGQFKRLLKIWLKTLNLFDPAHLAGRLSGLRELSGLGLPRDASLLLYYDALMFTGAHASSPTELACTEKEIRRIDKLLAAMNEQERAVFEGSGLPYTHYSVQFTHDFVRWLGQQPDCKLSLDGYTEDAAPLSSALLTTLPAIERGMTSAGLDNDALLEVLVARKDQHLPFLLDELSRFDGQGRVKDHLWSSLGIFVKVQGKTPKFSRGHNRLALGRLARGEPHWQTDLLRHFDGKAMISAPLPPPTPLSASQKDELIRTLRYTMALTVRETDPATCTDLDSLRLYELERGIAVAIFGMTPSRQMPLESYVGFTLFKNGFPAAYGGSWVFGRGAKFGINIFEPFRGGESGVILCQILRVYRGAFDLDVFDVDPYQYGRDNPDGIASGAFWFYDKFGFRPLDPGLARLADRERQKIKTQKGYRSSEKTLLRFTEDRIALRLDGGTTVNSLPMDVSVVMDKTIDFVRREFNGIRSEALKHCIASFRLKSGLKKTLKPDQQAALEEMAMMAHALQITDPARLHLMLRMIEHKPRDVYAYQRDLLEFFSVA